MTETDILSFAQDSVWTLIIVSAPLMLIGLIIGFIIALIQALTQIQESTLVFVPKILAMFVGMLVLFPFMGQILSAYMERVAQMIIAGG